MPSRFIGCAIALLTVFPGHAQTTQKPEAPPRELTRLQMLLLETYPQLKGRALQIRTDKIGAESQFVVTEVPSGESPVTPDGGRLLEGSAKFDSRDELQQFLAKGALLRGSDNLELTRAMAAARKLGRDPDAEVNARSVAYGPDQRAALLLHADWGVLEQRLGTVTVEAATPRRDPTAAYGFLWDVTVMAQRPRLPAARYVVSFEPFEGHLVSVAKR